MDIKKLEAWYIKNHRKLPFRESKDPYQIWVSEVMLQQTQMETVLPFFNRFMNKYSTVYDLAQTDLDTLKKDVEGLGYYRRFKMMHQAALIIVEKFDGIFPKKYEDIIKLPGIGSYTAGAILSIAFETKISALDGNVIRVLSRYLGDFDDFRLDKHKKKLNIINQSYIEQAHPSIYTQAMMELGALICRPKAPKCEMCPLQEHCFAYHENMQDKLPVLSKLKKQKEIHYITLIIEDDTFYYLRKRDESLLEGMYEYPQYEAESMTYVLDQLEEEQIQVRLISKPLVYKHVFSHQIWHMEVYKVYVDSVHMDAWVPIRKEKIHDVPMAIAHRKINVNQFE